MFNGLFLKHIHTVIWIQQDKPSIFNHSHTNEPFTEYYTSRTISLKGIRYHCSVTEESLH